MNKDEILLALRHVAMGRSNTPLQEEFAEKLAAVFVKDSCEHCKMPGGKHYGPCPNGDLGVLEVRPLTAEAPKRGPGRPKKAD